jgi:hypothetical protein
MNATEIKQVKKLLELADAAVDLEFVDVHLVSHFHTMREELGLAKLLLLIQDYARNPSQPYTEVSKASQQNQDPPVVQ